MERRLLTAKRRCGIPNETNARPQQRDYDSSASSSSSTPQSPEQSRKRPLKNIASARMKSLRESLANELNESQTFSPPAKRFAPDTKSKIEAPIVQHTFTPPSREHRSSIHKSPRKNCTPYVTTTPRQSVNRRLHNAVTSTPELKNKTEKFNTSAANISFTQFAQNYTATTSGILNDEDVNITDLSSTSNYSNNLCSSSASNVSLFCNPNDSMRDELENMEWSPVSEEQLLSNIRDARVSLYQQNQQPVAFDNRLKTVDSCLEFKNIYIVVDTNIFIDKLQTVINIMHISYADNSEPVIYVPWMVIQELDYFKDGYSLSEKHPISKIIQTRCRKAVKFINDCLIARKSNFKGQPVQRAADSRFKGQSPDDSILSCCVQLYTEGYNVVLLSSDTNLRNKAIISNITAFAPIEIMKELKKKSSKKRFNFVEEISKKLALICSFILHFEIKAYYGEDEYENQSFKNLPWQFKDCIKYLSENYDPVFRQHVPKQCRKVVDDLREFLFVNEEVVNDFKFKELCLSLLIYLQTGLPKYETNIQNTIDEINQLDGDF